MTPSAQSNSDHGASKFSPYSHSDTTPELSASKRDESLVGDVFFATWGEESRKSLAAYATALYE